MNLVQPQAQIPEAKLLSESGQGHCITLTVGGMLSLIFFHSTILFIFYPIVLITQLAIDMTHLDTLVTSVQPLRSAPRVPQRTKRSHASRARGSLSHRILFLRVKLIKIFHWLF